MLKPSVVKLINEQINKEFFSAYLYLDMANYYNSKNLDGFANWFIKEQGEEEKNAEDNIGKYDLFAGDPKGLYALNAEMLARIYTAPSLVL